MCFPGGKAYQDSVKDITGACGGVGSPEGKSASGIPESAIEIRCEDGFGQVEQSENSKMITLFVSTRIA